MTVAAVTELIEAAAALTAKSVAVTERAAAVYQRGRWLISNVSDVRIMWNITAVCAMADTGFDDKGA
jgi:hypothetical protein